MINEFATGCYKAVVLDDYATTDIKFTVVANKNL